MRRAQAANQQPAGPRLCRCHGRHFGRQTAIEECKPDLMILDLRLKAGDALDFIKTLRIECPQIKVLVLSLYDELTFAERALRAGASGYIMKENTTDEVLRAVHKVLAGELYFSERVAAAVVQRALREKPAPSRVGIERLSDREMQIFQLLGSGLGTRNIAELLSLSVKTVESHARKYQTQAACKLQRGVKCLRCRMGGAKLVFGSTHFPRRPPRAKKESTVTGLACCRGVHRTGDT